jgi:hypothetical protein
MTMVTIANEVMTHLVVNGSLSIDDALHERSTCSFVIQAPAGTVMIEPGDSVTIMENGDLLFAGTVNDLEVTVLIGSHPLQTSIDVQCTDWQQVTDRRIVSEAFVEKTTGQILSSLVDKYLAIEGITANVDQGPVVREAVFNYVSFTTCVDKLAEISGYNWWISPAKVLHFKTREALWAPFEMTDLSPISRVRVTGNRDQFRNRQYIKGGKDITDPQTESFKGNGTQKTFTVGFPLADVRSLTVNGVAKTVGIRGVDGDKEWYWNKGDFTISQNESVAALSAWDTLSITYQGLFDIVAISTDVTSVTGRKLSEGGSGFYDHVEEEPYITNRESAFQSADAKLRRFAALNQTLTFQTRQHGFQPGHMLTVSLAGMQLFGTYLIQRVSYKQASQSGYMVEIVAISGEAVDSWVRLFRDMTERSKTWVIRENIRENQVLVILESFEKVWTEQEVPNLFRRLYPNGTRYPGSATYPSFAFEDRTKYLAWIDASEVEIGRKALTKQTGADTDEMESTTYISRFEANGPIAKLAWIGGLCATAAVGSGIRVHEVAYVKEKTDLESLQIVKMDRKGW